MSTPTKLETLKINEHSLEAVEFAFVGAIVPSDDAPRYPGFSMAGNLWQHRLLEALQASEFICTKIISVRPVPSFPRLHKVFFSSDKADLPNGLTIDYLAFINVGPIKTLTLGVANFISLLAWGWRYRHKRNKVILTYNVNAPAGFTTLLAAQIIRTKAFAIIADLPVPGHGIVAASLLRQVEFLLQTKSLGLFDGLIVLTRAIARDFAPQVPFLHMEGAVDGALMEPIGNESYLGMSRRFTLMYAGSLSEFNGIQLLLEAFERLDGDRWQLLIVGRGSEQERVKYQAQRDSRISYLGFVPHEKVLQLYQRAHILINPRPSTPLSTRYVFPSKLIEFLATGKPVITTATVDVRDEYGQLSFILEDETPDGLANLIYQVAAMPDAERCAMGQATREYMLQHKNWLVQGQRIVTFIREQLKVKSSLSGCL